MFGQNMEIRRANTPVLEVAFEVHGPAAGVPAQRIGEILAGKRAITADTDLRLRRFFGLSNGWWLPPQADYDTEVAKANLAKTSREDQAVEGIN